MTLLTGSSFGKCCRGLGVHQGSSLSYATYTTVPAPGSWGREASRSPSHLTQRYSSGHLQHTCTTVTFAAKQDIQSDDRAVISYRLDGKVFNARRLHSAKRLTRDLLQYTDAAAIMGCSPEVVERTASATEQAYAQSRLAISTDKPKL